METPPKSGPAPEPSAPQVVVTDTETPAPIRSLTPDAPPPKQPSATLETPSTPLPPRADISEFDPFSTPSAAESSKPEPTFNFSGFLKDLRQKSAEPIARYLKSFLSNFAKKPFTINEQIKLIHDFLKFIAEKLVLYEPWKSQTPAEIDNAMEAMEKLVMNRLYNYTFTPALVPTQPITTDDLERDAVFAQRVRLFGWIREKHLDVPEGEASQGFLGFAEQELLKINHYKAPRDKMICILNCCKVIFGLIRHTAGPDGTSADAFVPILIFVVLRANPESLISNIEYINRFRSSSRLQGESGYYLSSLSGAIAFIESMDASTLSNINQLEFESNVEKAIQDLPPSPTSAARRPLGPTEMSPFVTSPGEEPARALSLSTSFDTTRKFFQRTGNLAQEAVSRPLTAIGKILDGIEEPRRPVTPETPSRRFAQLGLVDSPPLSGSVTPTDIPVPDFSSQLQSTLEMSSEAHAQTRRANVDTLLQMFPGLDEDIVEAVLEGCGDDLGLAIDKLLEM